MSTQKFSTLISISFLTYILYTSTSLIVSSPKKLFRKVIFLKRCAIQFFSNLVQLTAIHTTLKKLQQKDGVTVIVVALHAHNSRCFFQFRQKFFSYSKNDESYYYSLFVFLSFNFSVKWFQITHCCKNVKKWTVLTLSHGSKCVIHVIHLLSRSFSFL